MTSEIGHFNWDSDHLSDSDFDDPVCIIYSQDNEPFTTYQPDKVFESDDALTDDEITPERQSILNLMLPRQRLHHLEEFLTLNKNMDEEKKSLVNNYLKSSKNKININLFPTCSYENSRHGRMGNKEKSPEEIGNSSKSFVNNTHNNHQEKNEGANINKTKSVSDRTKEAIPTHSFEGMTSEDMSIMDVISNNLSYNNNESEAVQNVEKNISNSGNNFSEVQLNNNNHLRNVVFKELYIIISKKDQFKVNKKSDELVQDITNNTKKNLKNKKPIYSEDQDKLVCDDLEQSYESKIDDRSNKLPQLNTSRNYSAKNNPELTYMKSIGMKPRKTARESTRCSLRISNKTENTNKSVRKSKRRQTVQSRKNKDSYCEDTFVCEFVKPAYKDVEAKNKKSETEIKRGIVDMFIGRKKENDNKMNLQSNKNRGMNTSTPLKSDGDFTTSGNETKITKKRKLFSTALFMETAEFQNLQTDDEERLSLTFSKCS